MHRAEPGAAAGLRAADACLSRAVTEGLLPAAVLEIGTARASLGRVAVGTVADAVFDLASLTKVLGTGLVAASLVGTRRLDLDTRVSALVPQWDGRDRASVTVRDLLAHASGLPAYAPLYEQAAGREPLVTASARAALEVPPRTHSIYSDLGFIVLGRLLEHVAGADLDVLAHVLLSQTGDDPPRFTGGWPGRIVLGTGRSAWRGRDLHGEVHDDNAAAMGGIAGHAGLFGSASGVGAIARTILRGMSGESTSFGPSWVLRAFARRSPVVGSSRALAWDTALPTSSCGAYLTHSAVGHTGYTGTSLWIDPQLDLYVVLLTNRVAARATTSDMTRIRREVHDLIASAWRERVRG